MGRVQDQVAVVTGAAKGLGEAISQRLAQEGAKLIIGDIDGPRLETTAMKIRDAGGEVVTVVGDITEEEPAFQLIENAIEHFGQIDILVNNVGGSRNAKIWQMSVEDWDYTMRLNLRGTFLCTRAAVSHMIKKKRGKIVCLSRLGPHITRVAQHTPPARRVFTASCGIWLLNLRSITSM